MGKQSARLYYDGKDHKDIYFYERYHMAMVKEGEIIWSKMLDDCLILFRDNFIVIITKKDAVAFKNFDNVFRYYHSQFHTGKRIYLTIPLVEAGMRVDYLFTQIDNVKFSKKQITEKVYFPILDDCIIDYKTENYRVNGNAVAATKEVSVLRFNEESRDFNVISTYDFTIDMVNEYESHYFKLYENVNYRDNPSLIVLGRMTTSKNYVDMLDALLVIDAKNSNQTELKSTENIKLSWSIRPVCMVVGNKVFSIVKTEEKDLNGYNVDYLRRYVIQNNSIITTGAFDGYYLRFYRLDFAKGKFYAYGYDSKEKQNFCYYSNDFLSWTNVMIEDFSVKVYEFKHGVLEDTGEQLQLVNNASGNMNKVHIDGTLGGYQDGNKTKDNSCYIKNGEITDDEEMIVLAGTYAYRLPNNKIGYYNAIIFIDNMLLEESENNFAIRFKA